MMYIAKNHTVNLLLKSHFAKTDSASLIFFAQKRSKTTITCQIKLDFNRYLKNNSILIISLFINNIILCTFMCSFYSQSLTY